MQRAILGILAVGFLIGGALAVYRFGVNDSSASASASVALRCGLLLSAIWLALPQIQAIARRWPPWMIFSGIAALAALIVRPKLLVILLPAIALLGALQFIRWLFQPLPKKNRNCEPLPHGDHTRR